LTSFRKRGKWKVFDSIGRSRTATLAKTDRDWQMRKKQQLDVFTDEKRTSGFIRIIKWNVSRKNGAICFSRYRVD